jgi:nicotinamidase-related amidase
MTTTITVPTLEQLADPKRAALVLVDLQAHVLHDTGYIYGSTEALQGLGRAVAAARAAGVRIVCVRVVEREEWDSPVWVARHVTKPHRVGARRDGSPGAEFHPDFLPQPGDKVIVKRRYSAFFKTDLEETLRGWGVDAVFLAGIATNICVEATAVDAFQREFWTVVIGDGCATRTPEEQTRALADIERNWGMVTKADELAAIWQRQAARPKAVA